MVVIVEFTCMHSNGRQYFVGKNILSVLEYTHGGHGFGGEEYSSFQQISEHKARQLGLSFLEKGIQAVRLEHFECYKLQTPSVLGEQFDRIARSGTQALVDIFVQYARNKEDARKLLENLLVKLPKNTVIDREQLETCLTALKDLEQEAEQEMDRLDWRPNA